MRRNGNMQRGRRASASAGQDRFPLHLFFPLLNLRNQYQVHGVRTLLDKCSGNVTYKGRPEEVRLARSKFVEVLKQVEREDQVDAQKFVEQEREEVHGFALGEIDATSPSDQSMEIVPELVSSYSWNVHDNNEPYSVPGRLRLYPQRETSMPNQESSTPTPSAGVAPENGRTHLQKMEAIVMAGCANNPSFTLADYDIVTDRNNIRKIFRWVCGELSRWRIDLEKVSSSTIAMLRFDLEDSEVAVQNKVIADKFEESCCGRTNHSYRALLGLNMLGTKYLMRCEIDGALRSDMGELEGMISCLSVSSAQSSVCEVEGSGLLLCRSRQPLDVPFVELKTCVKKKFDKDELSKHKNYHLDVWCQAYLAGVQRLVIGLKDEASSREVQSVKEYTPDEYLEAVEIPRKEALAMLRKTLELLNWVKKLLDGADVGDKFSLLFEPRDNPDSAVKLYRRPSSTEPCFPPFVYKSDQYRVVEVDPTAKESTAPKLP